MRLTSFQHDNIVQTIKAKDPESEIFLYGSRTDDSKRGGDIDILIISELLSFSDLLKIQIELDNKLDEFPIDIFIEKNWDSPFCRVIKDSAIRLDNY